MPNDTTLTATIAPPHPVVRRIGLSDLGDALRAGYQDYSAFRTDVILICLIYPVVGLILGRAAFGYDVLPLIFPLATGFALVGPFAAIGLYELSRRREQGLSVTWWQAFAVLRSPAIGAILLLGAALGLVFLLWIQTAQALSVALLGNIPPASIGDFFTQIFTTPGGRTLILVGNGLGFVFAVVVLTLAVVSFPLLVDDRAGATTAERLAVAVQTSARAVAANPLAMAGWGLIVAALLLAGSIPFFIGLAVVMPVLGHATWHLYRRVIA